MRVAFYRLIILVFACFLLAIKANTQSNQDQTITVTKEGETKELIATRKFVFEAQTVMPLTGAVLNVTPDYSLTILPDKVISNLPYFGRAYAAPINPDESGIQFKTENFTYEEEDKKGGWNILIKPQKQNVQQLQLFVNENGYADLTVISSDRQSISYRGVIKEYKEPSSSLL